MCATLAVYQLGFFDAPSNTGAPNGVGMLSMHGGSEVRLKPSKTVHGPAITLNGAN